MVEKMGKSVGEVRAKVPERGKTSLAAVSASTIDELHALGYLGSADAGSATDVPEPSLLPDPKDKIEEQNLLHIATMASEAGEPGKARAALEKVLQLDESSAIALRELGRLRKASRHCAKTRADRRRAADAPPNDP